MKRSLALIAAALALGAANTASTAPRESSRAITPVLASAMAQDQTPLPWLLAQVQDRPMPTCETDGRQVPVGTVQCRKKQFWSCERNGWTNTNKPC
ncbi:MAG: hypothetical protein H7Y16_11585 [Candidatus Parcubacteria bacterium]|nr:hypothetical protein [Burkholderiales bacterium]